MIKTERKLFIIKLTITEPNNGLPTEINSLRVGCISERGFKKATFFSLKKINKINLLVSHGKSNYFYDNTNNTNDFNYF